ncbi:MAG: hypothetical protein QXF26_06050, partial [Candidatus Bathyarchaeia archaeon]
LIIALGNPNVTGLRYAWLIDDPNAPYPRARSQGLIKKEGNVKKAYREIEELMRQLFVEKKMRVTERLEFSGLAGRYRIDVEGFDPGYFHVKEDDDNVITVQLMKPSPQTNVTISTTCTECSYIYGWDYKRIINNPILVTIIILVPTVLVLDFFRTRRTNGCSVKKR